MKSSADLRCHTNDTSKNDENESNDILPCPYKVGAILEFSNDVEELEARITKLFVGGSGHQFSNSCTVQVSITKSKTSRFLNQDLVLKVFDWRYAAQAREHFNCEQWNDRILQTLVSTTHTQNIKFRAWLLEHIGPLISQHRLIRQLKVSKLLPARPTNLDLFGYVVRLAASAAKMYVNAGLIPFDLNIANIEVFLRVRAELQLAAEDYISGLVRKNGITFMPQAHGAYHVRYKDFQTWKHQDRFPVSALLMEKAVGQPAISCDGHSIPCEPLEELARQLVRFHVQLWRCNLEIIDGNLHNMLLYEYTPNHWTLNFVDYGALGIVSPPKLQSSSIWTWLPHTCTRIQLPQETYRRFFNSKSEVNTVTNLVEEFAVSRGDADTIIENALTHCFNPVLRSRHESFLWYFVMLTILRAFPHQIYTTHIDSIIQMLCAASWIIVKESRRDDQQALSIRIIERVTSVLNFGPMYAKRMTQCLYCPQGGYDTSYDNAFVLTQGIIPYSISESIDLLSRPLACQEESGHVNDNQEPDSYCAPPGSEVEFASEVEDSQERSRATDYISLLYETVTKGANTCISALLSDKSGK